MDYFLKHTSLKRFPLEDFRFVCFLGKGASGSVYKHSQNGNTYAVKVLKKDGWEEADFYEDLLWQSEIIKKMGKLKNSVNFFGYDIVEKDNHNTIALVMEYFESQGDLYDHINSRFYWEKSYSNEGYCFKRGNIYSKYIMPQSEKLQLTKGFIDAVKELHSNVVDIVHGDIKTCNVILNTDDTIKIIDFGAAIFSEEHDRLCKTDWNHGTLGYSSPEDTKNYLLGKKSDIYSLGVSLIEIWCGLVWNGGEDFQTCRNEVLKALRMIEKNDKKVGIILRKMVDQNSNKRPTIDKVSKYFDEIIM